MLERLHARFANHPTATVIDHDLDQPLPDVGRFEAIVSSFAIHHLRDDRKRELYAEIFERLMPGGAFCNLEHVSSPTPAVHRRFLDAIGVAPEDEDTSNQLLDGSHGCGRSDSPTSTCAWKWMELALLVGTKSSPNQEAT